MQITHRSLYLPVVNPVFHSNQNLAVVYVGRPFRVVVISVEDDRETLIRHITETVREAETITGLPVSVPRQILHLEVPGISVAGTQKMELCPENLSEKKVSFLALRLTALRWNYPGSAGSVASGI